MQSDADPIEQLKKSLYSRHTPDIRTRRRFHAEAEESDLSRDWEHPPENPEETHLNAEYRDHSLSFFVKILIGAGAFFLVCLGVGAYLFFNGANLISADNIVISINGPVSVSGGTPFSFGVSVKNNNGVKLTTVDLEVDFPTGSVNPTDSTKTQSNYETLMDDVNPGAVTQRTVNASLYGQENSTKEILIKVYYHVPSSNATFEKDQTYDVLISSSPLTLSVSSFSQVSAGQNYTMAVTLTSNSQETIQNLLLNAVYPFGYTFVSSSPAPLVDKATWAVGNLAPGASTTVFLTGNLQGENQDSRVFNFLAGSALSGSPSTIGTQYTNGSQTITLEKPFMTVTLSFGSGDSGTGDYIGQFDKPLTGTISWYNNLPDAVTDAELHLEFSGNAFDKASVQGNGGFYDSTANQITWDKTNTPALQSIPAGGSGSVTFTVTPRDLGNPQAPVTNPSIGLALSVDGQRSSQSNVPQSISESAARTVQVASSIALSAEALYTTGPFTNTGPFPPKSEATTTYTIVWTVSNSLSAVSNAQVSATLPENVAWLGAVLPTSAGVTYDPNSRTVSWTIGSLAAYSGQNGTPQTQAAFQVALHPSATDVGNYLTLTNSAALSGTDNFTGATVYGSWGPLSTLLSSDPGFQAGDEAVVK